jgi:hypothetical protein
MVLLVIAFLAGAFVGGTIERVMVRGRSGVPRDTRGPRGGPPTARAPRPPGALPGWYEQLDLTTDQRSKIEAILSKRSDRVNMAIETACVVIRPARDSSSAEADAVLTASQRTKRDSIFASFNSRSGARPAGGGRGGMFGCAPPLAAAKK